MIKPEVQRPIIVDIPHPPPLMHVVACKKPIRFDFNSKKSNTECQSNLPHPKIWPKSHLNEVPKHE